MIQEYLIYDNHSKKKKLLDDNLPDSSYEVYFLLT